MRPLKLAAVAMKYKTSTDDEDKLICLNTMEVILEKNLNETRRLQAEIALRVKYKQYQAEVQTPSLC